MAHVLDRDVVLDDERRLLVVNVRLARARVRVRVKARARVRLKPQSITREKVRV